jgi:hypothetical protein
VIIISDYKYHCNFCNLDEIIERKMSEYKPVENCLVCGKQMNRKVEDMSCGMSIDTTGDFYRKIN